MTQTKENPGAVGAARRGNSEVLVSIYSPSQKIAQGCIAKRYHISRPHAVAISNILNLGGAENG